MISQTGENLYRTNEDWFTLPFIKIEDANCDNDSKISFGHSSIAYSDHLRSENTKIKTEIDCDLEMGGIPHDISSSSISYIKTEPEDESKHAMDEENDLNVGNYKIKSEEINIKEESGDFSCMDNDALTDTSAEKHCSSRNLSLTLEHYIHAYYNRNPYGLYYDFYSTYGPLEPDLELNKKEEYVVKKYGYCSTASTSKTFKDGGFEVTDRSLGSCRKKGSVFYFKKQYGKAPYKCICCTYSTCEKLLATKHFNETHKIHGYIYVCTFCAYATNVKDCLMLHIKHKHKCKMLKCNICHHEETMTDFLTKHHNCKVGNPENMPPNKEKTADGELELDSAYFDDELTIEKTELEFDSEIKQENEVVLETNIANMLLDQTNLSTGEIKQENGVVVTTNIANMLLDQTNISTGEIKQENEVALEKNIENMLLDQTNLSSSEIKHENEVIPETNIENMLPNQTNSSTISDDNENGEMVLNDTNSVSNISKPVSLVSPVRLNRVEESSNKIQKVHSITYIVCPVCGYLTKEVNNLICHMKHIHKCKRLKCNVCRQEGTLTDFFIKSHKCMITNIPPDTGKTSDRDGAIFEPLSDDEIMIETKLYVDSEVKQGKNNVATMPLDQTNAKVDNSKNIASNTEKTDDRKLKSDTAEMDTEQTVEDNYVEITKRTVGKQNGAKKSSNEMQKICGNTYYVCPFCGHTAKEVNSLISHMQHKHKCKMLKRNVCQQEGTLTNFPIKSHKLIENIPSGTEKMSNRLDDRELELDNADFEPLFDDEITIEKTELDVDSETKQEKNVVVHETNVATMSPDQTNLSNIRDSNRNENEVVLSATDAVSSISNPVSRVSAVGSNGAEKSSKKTQKIHGNTYICTFCDYTTKEVNSLISHMQYKHKCKTLTCSRCHCEATLSEFVGKPHKCKIANSENITSNTEEIGEVDSADLESNFYDEITIEKSEFDIENDSTEVLDETDVENASLDQASLNTVSENYFTNYKFVIATKEVQGRVRASANDLFKCTYDKETETFTCTQCSFETKDNGCLRKHFNKKHGNKLYKCLICGLKVKRQCVLSNHYREEHNIRAYLTKKDIEKNTLKEKNDKSNENEQNLTAEMDTEQTTEDNDVEVNEDLVATEKGTKNKTEINDGNNPSEMTKSTVTNQNGVAKSSNKMQKIRANTYTCPFCGYTVKEVNSLISHMQYIHKCKTLRCTTCRWEATLSEFVGKPHKCKGDNSKNTTSNTQKTDDANLKTKDYMLITATKEVQSQVRSSVNDLFKCTYDKETKTLTCTQCSFETKDRGCLRKHFKKKHGNKLHKCLICGFEVKQQRTLSNHYMEKHNIREYLTKKDIEKKNNEESNENEQNLTAEMDTEQTAEVNDVESNEDLAAKEDGTKNRIETSDCNESEKRQHKIETTKSTVRERPQIEEQTNGNASAQNSWEEFKCMHCDFKSDELKNVVLHIREVHNKTDVLNNVKTADVKPPYNLALNILICPYCELTVDKQTSLLEHIRKQHKSTEVLKCSQCNFKTKSEEGLKKHKAYTHELHACPECDYKAKQRVCVRRHFSRYHADKFHKCSQCDFKTYEESALSNHVYLEHDETAVIHKCNKCSYRTDSVVRFKKHHCRRHSEFHLYRCVHCEFKSRSRTCLVKHLENIHNEYIVK